MTHSQTCVCGHNPALLDTAKNAGTRALYSGSSVFSNAVDLASMSDLEAALSVSRKLVDEAIWSNDQCTFIGAMAPDEIGLPEKYGSFQGDVYEGTAGIARLLILANRISPSDQFAETIAGALRFALNHYQGYSLYSGSLGIGLVALESGLKEFETPGLGLINEAVDNAISDLASAPADLLSGIAGVIYGVSVLLGSEYADNRQSASLLRKSARLADQLVNTGEKVIIGDVSQQSWSLYDGCTDHLCGLAHGASGIALALESLSKLSVENENWLNCAVAARNFERRWYSAAHGSWADLRSDAVNLDQPEPYHYPHMWCHGSVGIAAERLAANSADLLARADKVAAMEGVLSHVQGLLNSPTGAGGGDHINGSQCHGLSSFIDLFIDAWAQTGQPHLLELVTSVSKLMKDDSRREQGLRSGVINGPSTPGLMMGDAGMAWALFRAARPETVPSCWRIGGLISTTHE